MGESKKVVSVFLFALVLVMIIAPFASSNVMDWVKSKITGKATETAVVNITISNNAPTVPSVYGPGIATVSTEGGYNSFSFNFTARDTDGSAQLNLRGKVNITKTGEAVRFNSTCVQINTFGSLFANYTCRVDIWYFDAQGTWNITADINDSSNAHGVNVTANFTVGQFDAFSFTPAILTFASTTPGATNLTPNSGPAYFLLNNTGNKDITAGNIEVNTTDLAGETNPSYAIYAGNISIGNSTGSSVECGTGTSNLMGDSAQTVISGTNLSRGNLSLGSGAAQEQLYPCIRFVGNELSSQSYSTFNKGAWTIGTPIP